MIIAGVVVQLQPKAEAAVLAALREIPGARCESIPAPGQAVVLLEAENEAAAEARTREIEATPGVLGVYPAYIHSEV